MDRNLAGYYLTAFRKKRMTPQCAGVAELFWSDMDDRRKLEQITTFLRGATQLHDDTVAYLKRGIRGHYGGEGYVFGIDAEEEMHFWSELHDLFPEHAGLTFVAADAAYAVDEPRALVMFLDCFAREPEMVYQLEGAVVGSFLDSVELCLPYELALLKATVAEGDVEEIHECEKELMATYASDTQALYRIRAVTGHREE